MEFITYYSNDQFKVKSSINKNGRFHGNHKEYDEKNRLRLDVNYHNGELHGNFKSYYSNGKLHHDYNYKRGKQHGYCKLYNIDGKITRNYYYLENNKHGKCLQYIYDDESIIVNEYYYDHDKKLILNTYIKK